MDGTKYTKYIIRVDEHGYMVAYNTLTKKKKAFARVVVEETLGIELDDSVNVHHKDRNTFNNSFDNLEVLKREDHVQLHVKIRKERKLLKYNDKTVTCPICKQEFLWTAAAQSARASAMKKLEKQGKPAPGGPFCSLRCSAINRLNKQAEQLQTLLLFNNNLTEACNEMNIPETVANRLIKRYKDMFINII